MEDLINSIIEKLKTIDKFQWLGIWNDQLARMRDDSQYAIQNPSCYIQLETTNFGQLGCEYQGLDILISIHIIAEELNALDNTIDNFYSIFTLRDDVIYALSLFNADMGGFMQKENEYQDYEHTNLYHYVLQYRMHWIDDAAIRPKIIKNPPTDLDIKIEIQK